jgi:phage terminase large subunit
LGYSDDTAIWWYQVIRGEIHVLEYYGASGLQMDDYFAEVKSKPYKYGLHWLPHDAKAKTLASGGKSIQEMAWKALGSSSVRIVPDLSVQDGIQAARSMLKSCWFDATKTAEGVESLKQYQREYDEDKKAFREKPRHDWTSHAADAFRMLAIAWREEHKPSQPEPIRFPHQQTINELIAAQRRKRQE